MIRLILIALSCCPGVFNYFVISPALWSHNSSAAFEMWVVFWILSIAFPIFAIVVTKDLNKPHDIHSRGGNG